MAKSAEELREREAACRQSAAQAKDHLMRELLLTLATAYARIAAKREFQAEWAARRH